MNDIRLIRYCKKCTIPETRLIQKLMKMGYVAHVTIMSIEKKLIGI